MEKIYRQGDLLFERIDKIPGGVLPSKSNIILRGEATGHAHRLENGQIFNTFTMRRVHEFGKNEIFIRAERNARIVHEEHGILELEAGFYMVIRQREFLTLDGQRPDWSFIKD